MLDWNDLRYFLAVAREGSTLAAGRKLRTSQTTVARRIAAVEQALGFPLFDKRQAGYVLTPAGEQLIARAEQVEASASAFAEAADAYSREVRGIVRITSEEIYATELISPLLRALRERHPAIVIEIDVGEGLRDLGAGEADIALRSSSRDQPAGLVGRSLCVDDWTLYCSREYSERHGAPRTVEELRSHPIIGGGGANLWRHYSSWLKTLGLDEQIAMHHATSTGLLTAVRSGFGIGVLPCVVADGEPGLVRCIPPRDDHLRVLWLLTHERLRHTPRIRGVIDFLYEGLIRRVRELERRQAA
jgi:DNA-binding transcriptional LysR family regulator